MKHHFCEEPQWEESHLERTIAASREAFLTGESEHTISHMEFLYQQSRYLKKRWWVMQGLLLLFLYCMLSHMDTDVLLRRSLGLAGPLFVILILPELWKNRSFSAMEVECTTFYPLRAIYAARLTLFAGVDLVLLTAFFLGATCLRKLSLWDMLIQFFLPLNVTCCICFRSLYSRVIHSQSLSLLLCCFWIGLWTMVMLNDGVYYRITLPVWAGLLTASCLYMGYTLCRGQRLWQNTLEVKPQWN